MATTKDILTESLASELALILEQDEGFVPTAYQDSEGYWTIGHGILIDPRVKGSGITKEESRYIKANRIKQYIHELLWVYPSLKNLDKVRQLVLVNMAFNLGVPRLMTFTKMFQALADKDYERASKEMLDSRWAKQVKGRALRLSREMLTGQFDNT